MARKNSMLEKISVYKYKYKYKYKLIYFLLRKNPILKFKKKKN